MQPACPPLRVDAADRLVRAVADGSALEPAEAGRVLLGPASGPQAVIRAVVQAAVSADARLAWRDGAVVLAAAPAALTPLEEARFCVLDLETTGVVAGRAAVREIGAVLLDGGRPRRALALEVDPSRSAATAVRRLLAFAGGAVLAGHNVAFDIAFLDHETSRSLGGRLATPVVDTMALARRLLRGRIDRLTLAALAEHVGSRERPCHRALPDARATADVLAYLVDVARGTGARSVGDLCALSTMRVRRRR